MEGEEVVEQKPLLKVVVVVVVKLVVVVVVVEVEVVVTEGVDQMIQTCRYFPTERNQNLLF